MAVMPELQTISTIADLRYDLVSNFMLSDQETVFANYDDRADILMFMFVDPKTPKYVFYMDSFGGYLVDMKTDQVIGIHIENYLSAFVSAHPQFFKPTKQSTWFNLPTEMFETIYQYFNTGKSLNPSPT